MARFTIRNIRKVLTSAANRLFGAGADGVPRELEPAEVRTLLSIQTSAEIAAAYQPIGSYAASSHTHTASAISDFSEATDDRVAALLTAGTNISITYNDAANTLTIANTASATSPGGSSGQLQYNNAGAFGGASATINSSGQLTLPQVASASSTTAGDATISNASFNAFGLRFFGNNKLQIGQWSSRALGMGLSSSTFFVTVPSDGLIGFANTTAISGVSGMGDTCFGRSAAGVMEINSGTAGTYRDLLLRDITANGLMCAGSYTVATLPSASANAGKFAQVTDSSVTANGSAVAGGGSSRVMVYSNATSWKVIVA